MPRIALYALLLFGALLPGLVLSIAAVGPFGSAVPTDRLLVWPNQSDVAMAFQAIEHMRTTPWSDGLLRASTFEGGTHISMTDGWPLFAILVRLLNIEPLELLRIVAMLTFPAIAVGGAALARAMGARTLPQLVIAATFVTLSAPALVRFDAHPHVAQIWTILGAAAVAIGLRDSLHPWRGVAIGTACAMTGFLLSPYLGAPALLLLVGGVIDRARCLSRPAGVRFTVRALSIVAVAFALLLFAGGYLDGDLSSVSVGYGMMGLNLLAPFYPIACDWCTPLPSLGPAPFWQDFNGAAFLGLGVLLAAIVAWRRQGNARLRATFAARPGLLGAMTLGVAYAIGSHAAIGPLILWEFSITPDIPGYAFFQSLRMSAAISWPALLVGAVAAAIGAVAPIQRRPAQQIRAAGVISLLSAVLIALQVISFAPILSSIGHEHRANPPRRDEIVMLERLVAHSPGGVRITPPISCRPSWDGDELFGGEFDLAAQLGRLTGEASIPFAGAREIRRPTWGWCVVPRAEELLAARRAGWSILYQGAINEVVLRPTAADGCVALPGYVLCPADAAALTGDAYLQRAGLAVNPTIGLPILPPEGLRAPDPRLGAAVSAARGWWTHVFSGEPYPEAPWHDARELQAVTPLGSEPGAGVALAWSPTAGTTLRLTYQERRDTPEPVAFDPLDGIVVESGTLLITGDCTADQCVVDRLIGLRSGRINLLSIDILP